MKNNYRELPEVSGVFENPFAGLMPNGNFVKYDTQETAGLPERPTPADQEITVYAGPQKSKSVYMCPAPEDIPDINAECSPGKVSPFSELPEPEKLKLVLGFPAAAITAPADQLNEFLEGKINELTPDQIEAGNRQAEAAKLFQTLRKAGHSPRNARRFVLKKLKVRINPNL